MYMITCDIYCNLEASQSAALCCFVTAAKYLDPGMYKGAFTSAAGIHVRVGVRMCQ